MGTAAAKAQEWELEEQQGVGVRLGVGGEGGAGDEAGDLGEGGK